MNAFEEFMFDDKDVLRFYRGDHGLICTINESMVSELREVESRLRKQQAEIEALKERIAFLEDKAVMVDYEQVDHQFSYKALMGEDMVEAQMRINNLLRQMVDDLPTKDKP